MQVTNSNLLPETALSKQGSPQPTLQNMSTKLSHYSTDKGCYQKEREALKDRLNVANLAEQTCCDSVLHNVHTVLCCKIPT